MCTILPKNLKIASIGLSDFKSNGKSKAVYLNYDGQSPFHIQTPAMTVQFDMSKYNADKDKPAVISDVPEKQNLQLSCGGVENNKAIAHFVAMIKGIDAKMLDEAHTNSKAWFKTQQDPEVLKELYTPLIHYPKDKTTGEITDKYPPTFRYGVMVQNGKVTVECVNVKGEPIEVTTITKGTQVTAILEVKSVWFMNSRFGITMRPVKLMIGEAPSGLKHFAFSDEATEDAGASTVADKFIESSDDEEEEAVIATTATAIADATIISSDEDNDESVNNDEEDEPVPEPPKKVVKKVVVKKNTK
jgi:hypothetical protein